MICLPPPASLVVTYPPQMMAHRLILMLSHLILLVVHLGSFVNVQSVWVKFHKSHMSVLNTLSDGGVIVVFSQEQLLLMW
jgi:hypothetical protein